MPKSNRSPKITRKLKAVATEFARIKMATPVVKLKKELKALKAFTSEQPPQEMSNETSHSIKNSGPQYQPKKRWVPKIEGFYMKVAFDDSDSWTTLSDSECGDLGEELGHNPKEKVIPKTAKSESSDPFHTTRFLDSIIFDTKARKRELVLLTRRLNQVGSLTDNFCKIKKPFDLAKVNTEGGSG